MVKKLGIIGCGKMAYALLKGISQGPSIYASIYACDTSSVRTELFANEFNSITVTPDELVTNADLIILAVKPGQIKMVLADTSGLWNNEKLLVSIAAGIKTAMIEEELAEPVPVVRVMPNTPCLIGEGASALAAGKYASRADLDIVQAILNKVGVSVIVDEVYMDAVTAVSGSGPAYVFLVAEAMMDSALHLGLNSDMARQLVLQTLKGSISMLEQTGEHPAILKAQVTSPGGTTIAGLRELEAGGIREAFFAAMERACQRSIELGKH
ncbi:MAG: pyrroline-5-carboxylate reductase [Firmicutes bacterium HGW-Firmicutes-15]|nr:MAG: pyrroline-5-carboxylate reductase [Firmicutes bacterium HGW-Firmicutes-15]